MGKMFVMYRNADVADSSGGSAASAQPETAGTSQGAAGESSTAATSQSTTQSGTADVPPDASSSSSSAKSTKDQAYYYGLKSNLEAGNSLSSDEMDDFEKWVINGQEAPEETQEDLQDDKPAEEQPKEVPPAVDPALQAILAKVGAKSLAEAPEKIDGLLKALTGNGSKNAEAIRSLEKAQSSRDALIADLLDGRTEAFEFAAKALGRNVAPRDASGRFAQAHSAPSAASLDSIGFSDEQVANSLDPDMMRTFNEQLRSMSAAHKQEIERFRKDLELPLQQARDHAARAERERASESLVREVSTLASMFPDMGVESGSLDQLIRDYAMGDGSSTDPRIERHIKVLENAIKKNISLDLSYKDLYWNSATDHSALVRQERLKVAQKIIDTKHASNLAGRINGGDLPPVTEADVAAWTSGEKPIPDHMMTNGGLDISKLPDAIKNRLGLTKLR